MNKYIILIALLIASCGRKEVVNKNRTFSKFPEEKNISFKEFAKYEAGEFSKMFIIDTILYGYDWRAFSGHFFLAYGVNSKKNIGKFIPHGRKQGKALGAVSLGLFKNKLWMYDTSLNKIILVNLNSSQNLTDSITYSEIPFSQKFYNIQFLTNNKIIGNSNYSVPEVLQEVDLNTGKILSSYGELTNSPKGVPYFAWKRANEAFLILKPAGDKVALAHRLSDNLEIVDLKTHEFTRIKGPENIEPDFSFEKKGDEDIIYTNENSRKGFVRSMATNQFIYLLFSGETKFSPLLSNSNTLFVYDWNGQPVKKIKFDRYVSGFTVSDDDSTLYAHDILSKFIVTAKI